MVTPKPEELELGDDPVPQGVPAPVGKLPKTGEESHMPYYAGGAAILAIGLLLRLKGRRKFE
ncbi:hypothetical protein PSTEL_02735 [Paenibacillus stellifer]|uniref:Gram-positive cocci surface proteins LPxTG domain-containing protein n=1 Tax=Paenibacillus stellifer TaxID=169760 RepID=A0A089LQ06_9BACL|nr:hypothetical protein PSTEL_02735 [Paenibacillus stellifer]